MAKMTQAQANYREGNPMRSCGLSISAAVPMIARKWKAKSRHSVISTNTRAQTTRSAAGVQEGFTGRKIDAAVDPLLSWAGSNSCSAAVFWRGVMCYP
jgi:hypothetical protein